MKLTYQDLHTLVDDLKYLVQNGGSPFFQNGGGNIWDRIMKLDGVLKSLFTLTIMIIVLFILYRFVFKGYPKVVMDIFTFSFFKRQDVDGFLTEKEFFYGNYRRTLDPFTESMDGYELMERILGTSEGLKDKLVFLDQCINTYYASYNFNARLTEAFKEYYLYFYKIQTNTEVKVYSWIPQKIMDPSFQIPQIRTPDSYLSSTQKLTDDAAPAVMIPHYNFYETLYEYKKKRGLLTDKDYIIYGDKVLDRKNDKDMIITMYARDRVGQTNHYNRVSNMSKAILDVAQSITSVVALLKKYPITLYLIIPPNKSNSDMQGSFMADYSANENFGAPGKLFSSAVKFSKMNEFSWYMLEALDPASDKYNLYATQLESLMGPNPSSNLLMFMRSYLNLPFLKRISAVSKIKLNYKDLSITDELQGFVNKHPIFTRIYLNAEIMATDKQAFYDMVMNAYRVLMDTHYSTGVASVEMREKVENLCKNGQAFLMLMNNLIVLDLYLNVYQSSLTKLYEEEYISNRQFFKALWQPFANEFWHQRVMEYYKRVFRAAYIKEEWGRYKIVWGKLGKLIEDSREAISSKFKKSIDKPDPGAPPVDEAPQEDTSYGG